MKIPVILQTDIGTDFDDHWALFMLLCQSCWDLKLVLTDTGNVRYRAAVAAKLLESCNRQDVEIGLGPGDSQTHWDYSLLSCVTEDDLKNYSGKVSENGVERLVNIVMDSKELVHLISIGPCTAIAKALEMEPRIAQKCCFTGMFGSIAYAHAAKPGAIAEYNVVCDIPSAQKVFSAPWHTAKLTPLDSCGQIRIKGENFQKLLHSERPGLKLLMAQYDLWHRHIFDGKPMPDFSSVLFDVVAIHLALSTQFLQMRKMKLVVDNDGFTRKAPAGNPFDVAVWWEDLAGFEDFITQTFLGE